MTQAEYDIVAGELMALAKSIEDGKRPGYTVGDRDVLANFKKTADRVGVDVGAVWATFFLKHIDAITAVMTRPDLPQAEEPPGRFADAINYLRLGYALWSEREQRVSSVASAEPYQTFAPSVLVSSFGTVGVEAVSTTTLPSVPTADTAIRCSDASWSDHL